MSLYPVKYVEINWNWSHRLSEDFEDPPGQLLPQEAELRLLGVTLTSVHACIQRRKKGAFIPIVQQSGAL